MVSPEKERILETLRLCESPLRAVFDNLPVGMILLDTQGEPVQWNQKFTELRGLEPDSPAWLKAIHPEDRNRVVESWRRAVEQGERWSAVYRFLHPDGRVVWVSARTSPVKLQGELLGHIRALEDVTPLKLAEQKLAEANMKLQEHTGELEKEVQERTANLQEAFAELDRLSYSIVHDMRAPLRAMLGFSKLLIETYSEKLDEEGKNLLERIATAAKRQDDLITGVLAYHSYVRDKFPIAPVNLDELVTSILETYANLQPPKVEVHVRRPLGWILGNDTLLMQSISALLSNAVKFVAPGRKPEVQIWTERTGQEVKFCVQDNGIGIAPEHHQRIFDIFETLHESNRYPGTGAGLPLAKKAVERMNGRIGVESRAGEGARFWISLPSAGSENGVQR